MFASENIKFAILVSTLIYFFHGCSSLKITQLRILYTKNEILKKSVLTLIKALRKCSSFLSCIVISRSLPITRSNSSWSFRTTWREEYCNSLMITVLRSKVLQTALAYYSDSRISDFGRLRLSLSAFFLSLKLARRKERGSGSSRSNWTVGLLQDSSAAARYPMTSSMRSFQVQRATGPDRRW